MSACRKAPRILIRPATALFAFLLLILDRSILALLPFLAALCHEAGHLIAMTACGVPVREIEISPFGAEIRCMPVSIGNPLAALIHLAGPGANLLCAAILLLPDRAPIPEFFAVSSLTLAALNLLPIRTLDGGCAVGILLRALIPTFAEQVLNALSAISLTILWLTAGWLLLLCGGNASLLLFCTALFCQLYL